MSTTFLLCFHLRILSYVHVPEDLTPVLHPLLTEVASSLCLIPFSITFTTSSQRWISACRFLCSLNSKISYPSGKLLLLPINLLYCSFFIPCGISSLFLVSSISSSWLDCLSLTLWYFICNLETLLSFCLVFRITVSSLPLESMSNVDSSHSSQLAF